MGLRFVAMDVVPFRALRVVSNSFGTRLLCRALQGFLVVIGLALLGFAQSQESVLYSFQGGTDGEWPVGRIVLDSSGNLYGATQAGGSLECWSGSCGVVYQLTPPGQPGGAWTESVLHVFLGYQFGDGNSPQGGLAIDKAGNLYGSTEYGGSGNCTVLGEQTGCGTLYELSPPTQKRDSWTETVLYNFQGGKDGFVPYGDLVFDQVGNLYGATLFGGGRGNNCGDAFYQYCGTIYELSPPKQRGAPWSEKVLYSFSGIAASALIGDGANPNGGLAIDSSGNLYGSTQIGGFNCSHNEYHGCGTVFALSPPSGQNQNWSEAVLHRFLADVTDGRNPWGGLTIDNHKNLYGTTLTWGPGSGGTVFRLSPQSGSDLWKETLMYGFSSDENGYDPEGSVIFTAAGNLCGTTSVGNGNSRLGSVYCLYSSAESSSVSELVTLHGFSGPPDGAEPTSGLTLSPDGILFGTTFLGGTGSGCDYSSCGAVFEVAP